MKDLEKIKSEEVAAQVQDANPGNFAIEQEVAAMVGATVPAPTEPSADDARELGAQLLVFLRRALLPIRSALRTAVAAIYAHLDSRCTDYTPAAYAPYQPLPSYDPMGTPPTPRTLPNLLTALTAFSARKISNGSAPSDGIPDGTSLAHLLCSTDAANAVTEIDDDNHGWIADKAVGNIAPNCKKATIRCKSITAANVFNSLQSEEVDFPELETVASGASQYNDPMPLKAKIVTADNLTTAQPIFSQKPYEVEKASFKSLRILEGRCFYDPTLSGGSKLKELRIPEVRTFGDTWGFLRGAFYDLILLEAGNDVNCPLGNWSPTNALDASRTDLVADPTAHPTWKNLDQFLQNFREHIALRLTANGTGKTLTLSQAVRNAIHAAESTYGIENIIVTQKGWTISPAPN